MLNISTNIGFNPVPTTANEGPTILMIDVGGSSVKVMRSGCDEMRKCPSGQGLTPGQMVEMAAGLAKDWSYDCVSIGVPGLVRDGEIIQDPQNLGPGWIGFDFTTAFSCPVRLINDAALQALAAYEGGRMLFIGLGTSIGCALAFDGVITNVELGHVPFDKGDNFIARLSKAARKRRGQEKWQNDVFAAVALLKDMFWPDEVVIGGGNAKHLSPFPAGCRQSGNRDALRGAERLWQDAAGLDYNRRY